LFELPDEEHSVGKTSPETEEEFETKLERLLTTVPDWGEAAQSTEFTDEMKERLSDLGYI